MKSFSFLLLALLGFSANSILCRMALGPGLIDAATFTTVRICAGALTLILLTRQLRLPGDWYSAAALFAYAILFSYGYARVGAAMGVLALFGAVQATMIGWGLHVGERVRMLEWLGLLLAFSGLVVLARPGMAAPDPFGIGLMILAGIAWGVYSLRGRGVAKPLLATAGNFVRCVPMAAIVSTATLGSAHATTYGLTCAVVSGAVASGIGYCLWYAALAGMTATRAAFAQLSVPLITTAAAVLLLDEPVTGRLLIAAGAILAGVVITAMPRRR